MSKSTPAPPDYRGAAQEQAQASRELTDVQNHANRPTINTPWGTQSWESSAGTDPSTGQPITNWTQNTQLNPQSQQALDQQMAITQGRSSLAADQLQRVSGELRPGVSFDNFTEMGGRPQTGNPNSRTPFAFGPSSEGIQRGLDRGNLQGVDPSKRYSEQAGDAVYNQFSRRNEPIFDRDRERNRTQLYNQGLKEGDAAYDDQMRTFDQRVGDARLDAADRAMQVSGAEASRMHGMDLATRGQQFGEEATSGSFVNQAQGQGFGQGVTGTGINNQVRAMQGQEDQQRFGQDMQGANYQNQQRQQQIAELMQQRGWSLNEVNALLSGQQIGMPQMPGFNQAQRSETPQILGATQMGYSAQMDAFNAQQAGWQGLMSGAAGLAPFAFGR